MLPPNGAAARPPGLGRLRRPQASPDRTRPRHGRLEERPEQAAGGVGLGHPLGVPLHAEEEGGASGPRPPRRRRRRTRAVTTKPRRVADGLVVVRVHGDHLPRRAGDASRVPGTTATSWAGVVAARVGERALHLGGDVLDERPPQRDVHHLACRGRSRGRGERPSAARRTIAISKSVAGTVHGAELAVRRGAVERRGRRRRRRSAGARPRGRGAPARASGRPTGSRIGSPPASSTRAGRTARGTSSGGRERRPLLVDGGAGEADRGLHRGHRTRMDRASDGRTRTAAAAAGHPDGPRTIRRLGASCARIVRPHAHRRRPRARAHRPRGRHDRSSGPIHLTLPEPGVTVNVALDLPASVVVATTGDARVRVSVGGAEGPLAVSDYADVDALRASFAAGGDRNRLFTRAVEALAPEGGVAVTRPGDVAAGRGARRLVGAARVRDRDALGGRRAPARARGGAQASRRTSRRAVMRGPTGYQDYYPPLFGGCLALEGRPGGVVGRAAAGRPRRARAAAAPRLHGRPPPLRDDELGRDARLVRRRGRRRSRASPRSPSVARASGRALRAGDLDGALALVVEEGRDPPADGARRRDAGDRRARRRRARRRARWGRRCGRRRRRLRARRAARRAGAAGPRDGAPDGGRRRTAGAPAREGLVLEEVTGR